MKIAYLVLGEFIQTMSPPAKWLDKSDVAIEVVVGTEAIL